MKKRILALTLVLCMLMAAVGCKKDKESAKNVVYDYNDFVVLGSYKNIEVEVDKEDLVITDDELNEQYLSIIEEYGTKVQKKEGKVEKGDDINLDFSGLLDGVAFENGTAKGQSYTVGSGKFIEDLDKGLVGVEIGKEVEIPCKFPADYSSKDLAGKDVIFKVTVNYVDDVELPKEDDELAVKVATDNGLTDKFSTIDGLKKYLRESMEKSAKDNYDAAKFDKAFAKILEKCTFNGMPEEEYNDALSNIRASIENEFQLYATYFGYTWDQYLSAQGMTQATYETYCTTSAEQYVKTKMVITLIAKAEGFTVSDEEYKENLKGYAEQYTFESTDKLLENIEEQYRDKYIEERKYEVLYYEVYDFIIENCVEVQKKTETSTEASTENTTTEAATTN